MVVELQKYVATVPKGKNEKEISNLAVNKVTKAAVEVESKVMVWDANKYK